MNTAPDSLVPAQSAQCGHTAFQTPHRNVSNLNLHASTVKEQGFCQAVSTRSKWTIFTKWDLSDKVDLTAPPIKSIADFLLVVSKFSVES